MSYLVGILNLVVKTSISLIQQKRSLLRKAMVVWPLSLIAALVLVAIYSTWLQHILVAGPVIVFPKV